MAKKKSVSKKVAILGDLHIGARGSAEHFVRYFSKFFEEVFIPYLVKNNIKTVIQLGDLFDKRQSCNIFALNEFRRAFLDKLKALDIQVIVLCGNHDVYYKNTNEINSPETLVEWYDNLQVFVESAETEIEGERFLILPWINKSNFDASKKAIEATRAKICVGHLELSGFKMYKNSVNEDGMAADIFKRFEYVFSGHFHHRSNQGSIHYLGTPYEMTWQDWGDTKGFHTFDLGTRELEFIENPLAMYIVNKYEDDYVPEEFEEERYTNRIVKILVDKKEDAVMFEAFYQRLVNSHPAELIIVERAPELTLAGDIENAASKTTGEVLDAYIDNLNTDKDKLRLKKLMQSVYNDAMNMEA